MNARCPHCRPHVEGSDAVRMGRMPRSRNGRVPRNPSGVDAKRGRSLSTRQLVGTDSVHRSTRPAVGCGAEAPQVRLCSGLEVARTVEIANQPRLGWVPSQPFLSQLAGRRVVDRDEAPEESKMAGWLGGDRHAQASAYDASDSQRLATLGCYVEGCLLAVS